MNFSDVSLVCGKGKAGMKGRLEINNLISLM